MKQFGTLLLLKQRKEILAEDFIEGVYDQDYFISTENSLEEKDLLKLKDVL